MKGVISLYRTLKGQGRRLAGAVVAAMTILAVALPAKAAVQAVTVSKDPYKNPTSYHQTEVEPDTFSHGSTLVSTFQMGRFTDGGASNVGFATSTDNGQTWTSAGLPALTKFADPPGQYERATDPAVAYDPKHKIWIIVSLVSLAGGGFSGDAIVASRSANGGLSWKNPTVVKKAESGQDLDSTWVSCDGWKNSPHFGNCYAEWDDFGAGNTLHMGRSTDGGKTWTESSVPSASVIGGKPLAQPDGTVVMPIDDGFESSAQSFVSHDGGKTYEGPFPIAAFSYNSVEGFLRAPNIASADVDSGGKVYVVWYDCGLRKSCAATNDIVMSTSKDGEVWSSPVRIPIDSVNSDADHYLPGLAVQPGTGGKTAHLAVTYWFYPNALPSCDQSTCKLSVGFIQSSDGGATWSKAKTLAGPFTNTWLPQTTQGYMVGDYSSISFVKGGALTVFANASQGTCQLGDVKSCHVPMAAPNAPLAGAPAGGSPAGGGRSRSLRPRVRGED
jgi:hypothetical protein